MRGLTGRIIYDRRYGSVIESGEPIIVIMGKKNDTLTPPLAAADVMAPVATLAKPEAAPVMVKERKKSAEKKPKKEKAKKKGGKKGAKILAEEIALRAYFIAEHRHRHGVHGDAHSDWIEAERQLKAEQKKNAKKR